MGKQGFFDQSSSLKIYLNPVQGGDEFHLVSHDKPSVEKARFYTAEGQLVKEVCIQDDNQAVIDMSGFESGVYIMMLRQGDKKVTSRLNSLN